MESNQMTGAISKVGLQITNESPEFRERLDTFQDWSSSVVNKYSLVRAGFKFIGPGDKVQCAFCGGKLYEWTTDDDPFIQHQKFFPGCAFILQLAQDKKKPVIAQYQGLADRRATFTRGSVQIFSPNRFAAAGFYYDNELTLCFYCGVQLRDWGPNDDPVLAHQIFNPGCGYIMDSLNFQRLGISEHADGSVECLRHTAESSLIKDPHLRAQLDDVTSSHPLVKELPNKYDIETKLQEMKIQIIRTGRNFETVADFIAGVDKRKEAMGIKTTDTQMTGPGPQLFSENQRLRQLKLCKSCNTDALVVFLPCGHLVSCYSCAATIHKCPICSAGIHGTVPVYYS
ncbi:E3 ubiquitin-protein ligase XIAP-like [Haliotis rufescens]|uniref:E3 ubiquitin-protein ligase XIAP-like n=1 Tax=Haliotis rufescens TaxID=6454 RepID=UPI00201F53FB|nr:E3 ubiquitin-protein ligase XIAP-like [Haliotis rufescens]XP_046361360.2 E3 ubiquitin-protein ligase XIAP-like [Haliotis rufescens]